MPITLMSKGGFSELQLECLGVCTMRLLQSRFGMASGNPAILGVLRGVFRGFSKEARTCGFQSPLMACLALSLFSTKCSTGSTFFSDGDYIPAVQALPNVTPPKSATVPAGTGPGSKKTQSPCRYYRTPSSRQTAGIQAMHRSSRPGVDWRR